VGGGGVGYPTEEQGATRVKNGDHCEGGRGEKSTGRYLEKNSYLGRRGRSRKLVEEGLSVRAVIGRGRPLPSSARGISVRHRAQTKGRGRLMVLSRKMGKSFETLPRSGGNLAQKETWR